MRQHHKLAKDWNIKPIANLKNKNTNKEIEEILYDINDKLYFFNNLYINSKGRMYLLNLFKDSADKLNKLSFTRESKQIDRKNEILDRLRELYKTVSNIPSYDDEYFNKLVQNMGKFKMALFIKEKNAGLTEENIFKWIRYNKLFYDIYGFDNNIKSIQEELLKKFLVFKVEE